MEENKKTPKQNSNNNSILDLFNEKELKYLFKIVFIIMGGVEIFIFVMCWFYQLGVNEFDKYGSVDVPFPWKVYFLLAFIVPVLLIFLIGVIVATFNKFVYGTKDHSKQQSNAGSNTGHDQFQAFIDSILKIPFLLTLLLLFVGAGLVYRIDDILGFIARLGQETIKIILVTSVILLIGGITVGLVWLYMNYNIKKKEMEYQYKRDVMNNLGIAFTESNEVVALNKHEQKLIEVDKKLLPVSTLSTFQNGQPHRLKQTKNS